MACRGQMLKACFEFLGFAHRASNKNTANIPKQVVRDLACSFVQRMRFEVHCGFEGPSEKWVSQKRKSARYDQSTRLQCANLPGRGKDWSQNNEKVRIFCNLVKLDT
jgi:hypothetical protein